MALLLPVPVYVPWYGIGAIPCNHGIWWYPWGPVSMWISRGCRIVNMRVRNSMLCEYVIVWCTLHSVHVVETVVVVVVVGGGCGVVVGRRGACC